MPLDGHWQRVNTPLRQLTRRERALAGGVVAFVVAATLAIVLVAASASSPAPTPGCVHTVVAGVMGGQPVDACGARARQICREHAHQSDASSLTIEASCRRGGIAS